MFAKEKDSKFTCFELGKMFRNIQLLVNLMNEVNSTAVIGALSGVTITQAVSLSIVIRLAPEAAQHPVPLSIFLMSFLQFLIMIFVTLGGLGELYSVSDEVMENLKVSLRRENSFKGKWKQKFVKSCNVLKVKVGFVSYMDKTTALTMLDIANDLTINILLLG